jgi:hypothetical protein
MFDAIGGFGYSTGAAAKVQLRALVGGPGSKPQRAHLPRQGRPAGAPIREGSADALVY